MHSSPSSGKAGLTRHHDQGHEFVVRLVLGAQRLNQPEGRSGTRNRVAANRCAPITYVAAQLGHTKPTTTLEYHAHDIPNEGGFIR